MLTYNDLESEAERLLWNGIESGQPVDRRVGDRERDRPAHGGSWESERSVRAELLIELLTRERPGTGQTPRALRLYGVRITGNLDLTAATLLCPLVFSDCHLEGPLTLDAASAPSISLMGSSVQSLSGQRLETRGDLTLDRVIAGRVDLWDARIGGRLSLRDAELKEQVHLAGAQIGGVLSLDGATLHERLIADGVHVDRDMYCRKAFTAKGDISLLGAHIRGELSFNGARLDEALIADGLRVDGGMYCSEGFTAKGKINLRGAHVARRLSFNGAILHEALIADGLQANQGMFCTDGFAADAVRLAGARIAGALDLTLATLAGAASDRVLNLEGATLDDEVLLLRARLSGSLSVDRATFRGPIDVSELAVKDGGGVSLAGARFEGVTRLAFSSSLRLNRTAVRGPLTLVPTATDITSLDSLSGATLEAPLVIPDGVSLRRCELRGAIGLANLHILAVDPGWPEWRRRRVLPDEQAVRHGSGAVERATRARTVEGSYRQLRAALEDAKAAPAAADFYYGEMEMRRMAAPTPSMERTLLWLYKVTSGYGLRAWRALVSYAVILLAVSAALRWSTITFVSDVRSAVGITGSGRGLSFHHFGDVLAFVARSSVSFLTPTTSGLTAWGTALLLLVRFAAPVFLALATLAIRARVRR
jgi:hypothetical protein